MPSNSRMLMAATRLMEAPAKVASVRFCGYFPAPATAYLYHPPERCCTFPGSGTRFKFAAAAKRRLEEPVPHLKKSSFCSFCNVFPCAEARSLSKSAVPDHPAMQVILGGASGAPSCSLTPRRAA